MIRKNGRVWRKMLSMGMCRSRFAGHVNRRHMSGGGAAHHAGFAAHCCNKMRRVSADTKKERLTRGGFMLLNRKPRRFGRGRQVSSPAVGRAVNSEIEKRQKHEETGSYHRHHRAGRVLSGGIPFGQRL